MKVLVTTEYDYSLFKYHPINLTLNLELEQDDLDVENGCERGWFVEIQAMHADF